MKFKNHDFSNFPTKYKVFLCGFSFGFCILFGIGTFSNNFWWIQSICTGMCIGVVSLWAYCFG